VCDSINFHDYDPWVGAVFNLRFRIHPWYSLCVSADIREDPDGNLSCNLNPPPIRTISIEIVGFKERLVDKSDTGKTVDVTHNVKVITVVDKVERSLNVFHTFNMSFNMFT
jgi:hypothetical protein